MKFNNVLSADAAHDLVTVPSLEDIAAPARILRDEGFGATVTYSKKVFVPLTNCVEMCATIARSRRLPGNWSRFISP